MTENQKKLIKKNKKIIQIIVGVERCVQSLKSMMRLYFEFIDYLGKTQTVSADVLDLKGLQDEPEETIFYDKNKPSKAVLIDGLPSKIKLLSDNTFEDTNTAMAFVYLILPFLGLISILMAFV